MVIRKGVVSDIDNLVALVDKHKNELGFVKRGTLVSSIQREHLLVADNPICAFLDYRHRKDSQTTIYNLVVEKEYRRQNIGSLLLYELIDECMLLGKEFIYLKCAVELSSNKFYKAFGFYEVQRSQLRQRMGIHWRYDISQCDITNIKKSVNDSVY